MGTQRVPDESLDRRIEADVLAVIGRVGVVPASGVSELVTGNAQRITMALRRLEAAGSIVYVRGPVRGYTLEQRP